MELDRKKEEEETSTGDFQYLENHFKFWRAWKESVCQWGLCSPRAGSYLLVSYVNQKMKTRPNDPKEMKHVCFAHYISLLTPRCLAFPVPCVWSWELGTDMRLRSQGEAKFSLNWWTHRECWQITQAKDTQVWHSCCRGETCCAFTNRFLFGVLVKGARQKALEVSSKCL